MAKQPAPRRSRASRAAAKAPPADKPQDPAEPAERVRRKQAVVIVHGMGEQRPLETLRGFVEAVWGSKPVPRAEPSGDDVWLVPDMRAGLTELARVTTRHNRHDVATDFYELYWSDLLVGNSLSQIKAWITGLLLRWPHQVPRESAVLWASLWVLVAAIVALAAYVGITGSFGALTTLLKEARPMHNIWTLIGSIAVTALLWWYLLRRLQAALSGWTTNARKLFPGIWARETPAQASLSSGLSWLAAFVLPPLVGVVAYLWFPWSVLAAPRTWCLIAAALIAVFLSGWVVPVLGDVARYVRTSPDAVSSRAAIRNRGLELLRALHGPIGPRAKGYDFGDRTGYERIVVVGHSLGSIIAYDVLRLLWQERGPTSVNPADGAALAALRELDAFCRAQENAERFDIAEFRRLQGKVSATLAEQGGNWLVSDFVTFGSPLTHAEFLVSRDRAAFEERKAERMFPTCPPMLEPGRDSFLYPKLPGDFAHHAAMFAAMRWTNIYDPAPVPVCGDFISGPCAPNFGPGVVDLPVRIKRRGPFGRLVTHTDYWNVDAAGSASDATGARLGIVDISADPKAHLTLLRKALALR